MSIDTKAITETVSKTVPKFHEAQKEVHKVIVGQEHVVKSMLLALLADGHILVEGLPGLAKTLCVNTLANVISSDFKRIQFTPDLLPADLTGTTIYNQAEGKFTVKKGPIFTNILLADEINRAPPKVQAALLEVMQERQVTIGGKTFETGKPFLVMATQNPIEQEGTYVLPEAQTDRFMMKVLIDYPSKEEEKEIIRRMGKLMNLPKANAVISTDDILEARKVVDQIYIDDKVTDYILEVVFATRFPKEHGVDIEGLLQFGASPRASIALQICGKAHAFLEGRGYVTPHDIKSIGHEVLRHRIRRSYEAEAEEISPDDILDKIFSTIQVP
ncbi:MAG: ATPase RavA [Chlamydiae bacterium]|nr:ATPase RavA [Chlamydiota bacterium]